MANNHYGFYAYQYDAPGGQTTVKSPNGMYVSLPSAGTVIRQAPANTTAGVSSVTILSLIDVLPTGLNVKKTTYYSDTAPATLNTAAT